LWRVGRHLGDEFQNKQRGISDLAKEAIEDLINNYDTWPHRIHIRLNRPNIKATIDKMPKLKQVQDYINNRKRRIGDHNNLDELEEFVDTLKYDEERTRNDEMFVFGSDLGDVRDDNPFSLAFTSYKLLRTIQEYDANNRGVYHLDCTYKIVKYNYPLLVFGFTDLARQFFPVAFMYTSHERESDFDFFFQQFTNICTQFGIDFAPKYMVTDACLASANAIDSRFPDCNRVTCFFPFNDEYKKTEDETAYPKRRI
jgi:hypothetical protein